MAIKINKRFDATIADSGVWFDVEDPMGNTYGSYLCALIDKHTNRWKVTLARMEREHALKQKRNRILKEKGQKVEDDTDNFAAKLFVELSLLDWKGLVDENDVEAPFNKDDALEFLCSEDAQWILEALYDRASNIANFQPDSPEEQQSLEELEAELASFEAKEAKKTKAEEPKAE